MHPAVSEEAYLIETILAAVIKNDGFDVDLRCIWKAGSWAG